MPAVTTIKASMPTVSEHPNRLQFRGRLTLVDRPSDKAPSGARGHRCILTHAAAEAALPGLIGMAIDFKDGWDGHNARQKIGVITLAKLNHHAIDVRGFLYVRDFPEVREAFRTKDLGMSYEIADAHVADMRSAIWTLTRATFTGAAVLLREKAAYRDTFFKAE